MFLAGMLCESAGCDETDISVVDTIDRFRFRIKTPVELCLRGATVPSRTTYDAWKNAS
jgi:hypothetical protein